MLALALCGLGFGAVVSPAPDAPASAEAEVAKATLDGRALPSEVRLGMEPRATGWFDRRVERLDWEGLARGLGEGVSSSTPTDGYAADISSTWLLRRSNLPHVDVSVRWMPQLGTLELRGVRLRLRDEGFGIYVERGDEDRDARMGFDYRRRF